MDPALDLPPLSAPPTPAPAAPAGTIPVPAEAVANTHPPYPEMITAAISGLNESDGSTKRAIANYIEKHYNGLPPTHADLLTHHLKQLKSTGHLVMVRYSYKLSTGSAAPAVNGAVSTPSKKRGRPPKPKPDAAQPAVPVFGAPSDPVNGSGPAKRGPGRPPKSGVATPSGRGRGRPKKNAAVAPLAGKGAGRPRGRPPKPINVVDVAPVGGGVPAVTVPVGAGVPAVTGKRRGRPPKAGGGAAAAKKPRKMSAVLPRKRSGRPVGRPRKNAVGNQTPESQLLVSYLGLKEKLDTLKEKVNETAALIKPSLNGEAAINALHELEVMAANINAPPDAQQPPLPVHPQI